MENCGSYRSEQFQDNTISHKSESEKSFRGETLVSKIFGGTENAGTLQFREQVGWREVMKKVYKTMGTTNSWQQNKRSPKLTIFRSRRLSTKLVGMCFNRDKKSPFHREQWTPGTCQRRLQRQTILWSSKIIYTNSMDSSPWPDSKGNR